MNKNYNTKSLNINSIGSIFVCLIMFFAVCMVFMMLYNTLAAKRVHPERTIVQSQASYSNNERITIEEYNQISKGMTFEEVKSIIGQINSFEKDRSLSINTIFEKTWYGYGSGTYATITFKNGHVLKKEQVGLSW